jgi:hypothetical protein
MLDDRAAVEQDWSALQHVSPALRDDATIVDVAVRQNWAAVEFASPHLQKSLWMPRLKGEHKGELNLKAAPFSVKNDMACAK